MFFVSDLFWDDDDDDDDDGGGGGGAAAAAGGGAGGGGGGDADGDGDDDFQEVVDITHRVASVNVCFAAIAKELGLSEVHDKIPSGELT